MTIEIPDFGLLEPVYPSGVVKLPVLFLNDAKLPGLCPKCLKPGDITETFKVSFTTQVAYNQQQIQTISIPLRTHSKCSRGFTKRNISGSVRIWGEKGVDFPSDFLTSAFRSMGLGGNAICFEFKNPVYALLFSRVNFRLLLNKSGKRLLSSYEDKIARLRKKTKSRSWQKCQLCGNALNTKETKCPSCGLDPTDEFERYSRKQFGQNQETDFSGVIGVARKCAKCDIIMLKNPKVKECARCGAELD